MERLGFQLYFARCYRIENILSGLDGASYWPQVRRGNQINKTIADGRWYPGRTDATYPRLLDYTDGRNRVASDFWVQDKSYLRVKNVQLGYTVPKHLSQKLLIDNFRLYVSIDNALTFTDIRDWILRCLARNIRLCD